MCTKSSSDYWHPPEYVKHKTNEGCKFGEKCAFLYSDNSDAPTKKFFGKTQNPTKQLLRLYAAFRSRGCVSRDVESLPDAAVGPTNVIRSILKKNGKRCPKAHLSLRFTRTAEHFINIREQLGPSPGVIQGGAPHHRSPNAPTFANRDPIFAVGRRRCKKSSLSVGQKVVQNSLNVPGERRNILLTKKWTGVASASNVNPDER